MTLALVIFGAFIALAATSGDFWGALRSGLLSGAVLAIFYVVFVILMIASVPLVLHFIMTIGFAKTMGILCAVTVGMFVVAAALEG